MTHKNPADYLYDILADMTVDDAEVEANNAQEEEQTRVAEHESEQSDINNAPSDGY